MRRIDLLITQAREETGNRFFTDETGIQDSEFLRWANSAQTRIQSLIQSSHPQILQKESLIAGVSGQEKYAIPQNTFLSSRVQMVEYSRTGETRNFYTLKAGSLHERVNGLSGSPVFYIRFSNYFLVQPAPSSAGVLRVITQGALPRLDIGRATVSSVVLDSTTKTVSSLILDTTTSIDATNIQNERYITIVDRDGIIKMAAIPVTEVNATTGVVTIFPGFIFKEGESITAGEFVTLGVYSSTNTDLPDVCERYIVDFMIWKLEKRDSSGASPEISQELRDQEDDIITSFGMPDDDVSYVTILDPQYSDYGDSR